MAFLNAAFYRFTPLDDASAWAARLRKELAGHDVRGTLIFAPEGVNGFIAGAEGAVRGFIAGLKEHAPFAGLTAKESVSEDIPFEKLCFKVKPEIVTFRVPEFDSLTAEAPNLTPAELSRWYEEGEDFLVLDTRNDYEVKLGAFKGAHSMNLKHFVDFPAAVKALPAEWKKKKILTYCTGGIRCEKAAPYMRSLGFDAYQLQGGILKHFEEEGGKHWEGECFVFDQRVALKPDLLPSGAKLCVYCQGPIQALAALCPQCGREKE